MYPAQVHVCRTKPPLQYFPSLWSRESPQGTLDCTVSHARIWYSRKDLNLYLQSSADWCNLLYTTRVKFWRLRPDLNRYILPWQGSPLTNYGTKPFKKFGGTGENRTHHSLLAKQSRPLGTCGPNLKFCLRKFHPYLPAFRWLCIVLSPKQKLVSPKGVEPLPPGSRPGMIPFHHRLIKWSPQRDSNPSLHLERMTT